MPLHARQCDLLSLRQDTRLEVGLIPRQRNVIVAGETTGHAHLLTGGSIEDALDDAFYLDITQTAQVGHEEHAPLTLERGLWLVVCQQEYSPEAIRTVLD